MSDDQTDASKQDGQKAADNYRRQFEHAERTAFLVRESLIDALRSAHPGASIVQIDDSVMVELPQHKVSALPVAAPVPMVLNCPSCGGRHIDKGEFATKPHHTHACQHCGMVWRPALVATVGVQFLPGFKDKE